MATLQLPSSATNSTPCVRGRGRGSVRSATKSTPCVRGRGSVRVRVRGRVRVRVRVRLRLRPRVSSALTCASARPSGAESWT